MRALVDDDALRSQMGREARLEVHAAPLTLYPTHYDKALRITECFRGSVYLTIHYQFCEAAPSFLPVRAAAERHSQT